MQNEKPTSAQQPPSVSLILIIVHRPRTSIEPSLTTLLSFAKIMDRRTREFLRSSIQELCPNMIGGLQIPGMKELRLPSGDRSPTGFKVCLRSFQTSFEPEGSMPWIEVRPVHSLCEPQ